MIRLLAILLLLAGCATTDPQPEQLQTLRWTGKATVGPRPLVIEVRTRVVPFHSARSDTKRLDHITEVEAALIIEPDGGWIERFGARQPMPAAMLAHERQQYAIYGLMQLALAAGPPRGGGPLTLSRPPHGPETRFTFAPDGRLATAANRVDSPDGGAPIEQLFRFSGELRSGGLRWPRQIDILHGGKPYFTLELSSFEAGPERSGGARD